MSRPVAKWIATCGIEEVGPGTIGSMFAIPLCYALLHLSLPRNAVVICYAAAIVVVFVLGLMTIRRAQTQLGPRIDGHRRVKDRDQGQIVIDEVLGMLISYAPFLFLTPTSEWLAYGLAFGLFRLFDITKPPPVRFFDRMKSPAGVMLDDAVAGLWAVFVLVVLRSFELW